MTTSIDEIKQTLGEVSRFVKERYDPLAEEVRLLKEEKDRVVKEVENLLREQRELKRASLLGGMSNDRPRVRGGRYHGLDALDLGILRGLAGGVLKDRDRLEPDQVQRVEEWHKRVTEAQRAMDATTATAGDEIVPTGMASQLWADVNLVAAIAPLVPPVGMPTNPFDMPLDFGDVNWYPNAANVAPTGTDPATAKRTLTAYQLSALIAWAYELDEDAVLAVMPAFRNLLVRNAAEVLDDVVLNGDTTLTNNINADGATIAKTDTDGVAQWLLGFDGLRHIPLVDNTGQGTDVNAALTVTSMINFTNTRALLGKYGVRASDLVFVVDIPLYIAAMSIADIVTLDKYGPQATVLTGEIAKVQGVPVIVSEVMRETDDDGKVTDPVTDSGNDNSGILCFNRNQYAKGFRRELMIEAERDIQKQQTVMVASMRVAFEGRNANASDKAVGLSYNIT